MVLCSCRTKIDAHAEQDERVRHGHGWQLGPNTVFPLPTGKRPKNRQHSNCRPWLQVEWLRLSGERSDDVRNQASSCERPTRARLGLPSARKEETDSDWTARPRVTNSHVQLWHRYGGRGPGPGLGFLQLLVRSKVSAGISCEFCFVVLWFTTRIHCMMSSVTEEGRRDRTGG